MDGLKSGAVLPCHLDDAVEFVRLKTPHLLTPSCGDQKATAWSGAGHQLERQILTRRQLQLDLPQQANGHQSDFQFGESFPQADPLPATKGEEGLIKGAIEMALRSELREIGSAFGP